MSMKSSSVYSCNNTKFLENISLSVAKMHLTLRECELLQIIATSFHFNRYQQNNHLMYQIFMLFKTEVKVNIILEKSRFTGLLKGRQNIK